jgi:hypothetical protein
MGYSGKPRAEPPGPWRGPRHPRVPSNSTPVGPWLASSAGRRDRRYRVRKDTDLPEQVAGIPIDTFTDELPVSEFVDCASMGYDALIRRRNAHQFAVVGAGCQPSRPHTVAAWQYLRLRSEDRGMRAHTSARLVGQPLGLAEPKAACQTRTRSHLIGDVHLEGESISVIAGPCNHRNRSRSKRQRRRYGPCLVTARLIFSGVLRRTDSVAHRAGAAPARWLACVRRLPSTSSTRRALLRRGSFRSALRGVPRRRTCG